MKKIIITLFLSIIYIYSANAQVMGASQYNSSNDSSKNDPVSENLIPNNDEILISVNGLMNVVADSYVATFNLIQVGETTDDVDRRMNDRIDLFRNNLRYAGISGRDIKIDLVSVVPNYDIQTETKIFSKSYNEQPAGFEMQKSICVSYSQSGQLEAIMTAAMKSEIYDLVKCDYFVKDISSLKDSLRNACMNEINKKVKSYEITGIKLESMKKSIADNNFTILPLSRYYSYQAFARPSLNSIKRKYAFNEVVKSTTKYYQPINYAMYDIILNPVITEPVVQLSYSVTIKYIQQENKPADKACYMLTPSGEMKQIILK